MVTAKYYNKLKPALPIRNLCNETREFIVTFHLLSRSTTFHSGSSGHTHTTPIFCASASAVFGRLYCVSVALSSYFWSLCSLEDNEETIFEETSPAISFSEVGIE